MSKARHTDGTITEWDERLRSVGAVEIEAETVRVRIAQTLKVTREVVVEIETYDRDELLDRIENGDLTGPAFTDPRWQTVWNLENEEVTIVDDAKPT